MTPWVILIQGREDRLLHLLSFMAAYRAANKRCGGEDFVFSWRRKVLPPNSWAVILIPGRIAAIELEFYAHEWRR